jgi:hypothetical protein
VLNYLREHGSITKQEAKEEVHLEYPVDGQNADTWYWKTIRSGLNETRETECDSSARSYRFTEGGVDTLPTTPMTRSRTFQRPNHRS